MKCIPVLLLVLFLLHYESPHAQTADLSAGHWAKKLADPDDKKNANYNGLYAVLYGLDSNKAFVFLNELAAHSKAKGNYFIARFNCLKSEMIYEKNPDSTKALVFNNEPAKKEIQKLLAEAMNKAYECNDDYLAAFVSGIYGRYMSVFGETEPAVMYMMNCADLYEKLNLAATFQIYVVLGETLWKVREYEKSLKYASKAIAVLDTSHFEIRDDYIMMCQNTVALSYHRMGQYDSAFIHYNDALEMATKLKRTDWQGIISGNMGQIYFAQGKYTTALPLFKLDYTISNEKGYYDNAANSLQWSARTNLALGNSSIALQEVRTAFELLKKWPAANYLQNAYFTAAEIFSTLKNNDSLVYYSGLYNRVHDSIEKVIYQSSISIAKLRLNDEKSRYSIINLQREKQDQAQQRNLIIAAILFVSVMALLLINRQRLKLKFQHQLADQEKLRMEQEMESARVQLNMITQNIIEKTNLIEQLEQQVRDKTLSVTDQQAITELTTQTILTEEDWDHFKSLFEKIFPLFFQRLKTNAADITMAEQRLAALIRLQLTTRQMASMLGISVDSVSKTRQRLRKRFDLGPDVNLEEYYAGI